MFSCSLPTGFRASNKRRREGNNFSIPIGGWSPAEESTFLASPVEALCVNVPLDHVEIDAVSQCLSRSVKSGVAAFTLAYMLGHDEGDLSRIVSSLPAPQRKQFCRPQKVGGADKILSSTLVEYLYSKDGAIVGLRVWRLAIDPLFSFSRLFGKLMQANRQLLQHYRKKPLLEPFQAESVAIGTTAGKKRRLITSRCQAPDEVRCQAPDEVSCAANLLELYEKYQNSGRRARLASGPVREVINRKFEKSSPLVADPLAAAASTLNAGMPKEKRFLAASSPEVHLSFSNASLCAGLPQYVCPEQCSSKKYTSPDGGLTFPRGAFLWCGGGSFWESPLPTQQLDALCAKPQTPKQDLTLSQTLPKPQEQPEPQQRVCEVMEYNYD